MKPFETEELRARIKNLIEQRKRLHEYFKKHGLIELEEIKITSTDKKFMENLFDVIAKNIPIHHLMLEPFRKFYR